MDNVYTFRMKPLRERLKTRLQRNRPMTTISLRMPADVIEDLKEIAPMLGFTGYQPLMRSPGSPDSLLAGVKAIRTHGTHVAKVRAALKS